MPFPGTGGKAPLAVCFFGADAAHGEDTKGTAMTDRRLTQKQLFDRFVAPARVRPALWRLLCGLVLVALVQAVILGAVFGGLVLLTGTDRAGMWMAKLAVASTPTSALALLATFVPLLVGVALAARLLHRRTLKSVLGHRPLRDALHAASVAFAVFTPLILLTFLLDEARPNLPIGIWAQILPLACIGIAAQTLAEELLFRGYLMQQLAARFRTPWIWALIPALAFAVLHFDPGRMGTAAPVVVAIAALFGLLAADLTARSGGIGLAWGMHFANNTVGLVIMAAQGSITGLALRVTESLEADMATQPLLVMAGVVPVLATWAILRRGLRD